MAEEWPRSSEDRDFESARERIYGHATSSRDGRQALLAAFLGLSVFLLVLALSTRQTTASGPAQRLISAGVAVTTDVDQLLADEREPIRQLAQNSSAQAIPVPGYPLEVFLTRDEALNATTPELRAVILQRSSALVYTQGLSAFDRTGHQSISRFSAQGMIDFAVGELSADTHSRASLGTAIFALTTALAVCGRVGNQSWLASPAHTWDRGAYRGVARPLAVYPWVVRHWERGRQRRVRSRPAGDCEDVDHGAVAELRHRVCARSGVDRDGRGDGAARWPRS